MKINLATINKNNKVDKSEYLLISYSKQFGTGVERQSCNVNKIPTVISYSCSHFC